MSEAWATILAMIGSLAGLWLLATLLAWHLQRLVLLLTGSTTVAAVAYDLLVLPGVVLHELAHLVAAVLLGVRIVRADLFRFRRPGDPRQGEVVVQRVDPLRMSAIGAAPLIAGVPTVLLLLRFLQIPPLGLTSGAFAALQPLLHDPLRLLGLYLVWAIANAMFPSAADRAAWWVVGVLLAIAAAFGVYTGQWPALPAGGLEVLLSGAARLTTGLLPVVALDLGLLIVVTGLEWLVIRR